MKILSISSLLPIPHKREANDIVFQFYKNYIKKYSADSVLFVRPAATFKPFGFNKRWRGLNEVAQIQNYKYDIFEVRIFPFFATGSIETLFALLSFSLYFFNKSKIADIVYGIDLCHAQYIMPDGVLAYCIKKRYDIPYVMSVRSEQRLFKSFISRRFAENVLNDASSIITPSSVMYDFLTKSNYKVKLIPHGLEDIFFENFKTKYEEDHPIRIVSISNLIPRKNIGNTICALSKLKDKYEFIYDIYGEGPEADNLAKHIKAYGLERVVKLKGKISFVNIPLVLKDYDIFALPSRKETFGRVYFEALAAGLPIILTKNTGVFGFLVHAETCLSVDPDNVGDISRKLEMLINDRSLREKLGRSGRKLAQTVKWSNVVSQFKKVYENSILKGDE